MAEGKVQRTVLVVENVAPRQCGLGEMIYEGLLPERESLEALDTVTQKLDVGKFFVAIRKFFHKELCNLRF